MVNTFEPRKVVSLTGIIQEQGSYYGSVIHKVSSVLFAAGDLFLGQKDEDLER